MKINHHRGKIRPALFWALMVTGISSLTQLHAAFWPSPEEGSARFNAARMEIAITRTNIVRTVELLHDIKGSADPQAQYKKFTGQLTKMEERADYTRNLALTMRTNGDLYFASWESQMERLDSPEARRQAEATFAERKQTYARITSYMEQAGKDFRSLLSSLEEIKKLLKGKPTPDKVSAAEDLFQRANWRCVDVQRSLMSVENELQRLAEAYTAHKSESHKNESTP